MIAMTMVNANADRYVGVNAYSAVHHHLHAHASMDQQERFAHLMLPEDLEQEHSLELRLAARPQEHCCDLRNQGYHKVGLDTECAHSPL